MSNKNYYQKRKNALREEAISWQREFGDYNYSWSEIVYYQEYFERLGRRYGLLTEFRENCIC